jgi:hypothetical protein
MEGAAVGAEGTGVLPPDRDEQAKLTTSKINIKNINGRKDVLIFSPLVFNFDGRV